METQSDVNGTSRLCDELERWQSKVLRDDVFAENGITAGRVQLKQSTLMRISRDASKINNTDQLKLYTGEDWKGLELGDQFVEFLKHKRVEAGLEDPFPGPMDTSIEVLKKEAQKRPSSEATSRTNSSNALATLATGVSRTTGSQTPTKQPRAKATSMLPARSGTLRHSPHLILARVFLYLAYFKDLLLGNILLFIGRLLRWPRVPEQDLRGRTAVITGGNSGIGFAIGQQLAGMGATVYLACRSLDKGEAAASAIRDHVVNTSIGRKARPEVYAMQLDNASFASVRTFAESWTRGKIDFLYHNAGFPGTLDTYTEDGHEVTYQTNFLSSFHLTRFLGQRQAFSPTARIIFTAATVQYVGGFSRDFSPNSQHGRVEPGFHHHPSFPLAPSAVYINTKTMQTAFALMLQQRFDAAGSQMSAHSFTPGFAVTPIFDKVERRPFRQDPIFWLLPRISNFLAISNHEGAATGVKLATADISDADNGGYWDRGVRRVSKADLMDQELLDRLWVRWCNDAGLRPKIA